jgi:hypothetical protein
MPLLASTQKARPTAISLWVRWSNTTYSPWDSVVRVFKEAVPVPDSGKTLLETLPKASPINKGK